MKSWNAITRFAFLTLIEVFDYLIHQAHDRNFNEEGRLYGCSGLILLLCIKNQKRFLSEHFSISGKRYNIVNEKIWHLTFLQGHNQQSSLTHPLPHMIAVNNKIETCKLIYIYIMPYSFWDTVKNCLPDEGTICLTAFRYYFWLKSSHKINAVIENSWSKKCQTWAVYWDGILSGESSVVVSQYKAYKTGLLMTWFVSIKVPGLES